MVFTKKERKRLFLNSQKNETHCWKCCFFRYASKVKAKESQVCTFAYNLNIKQKYKDMEVL